MLAILNPLRRSCLVLGIGIALTSAVWAAGETTLSIGIKEHRFAPAEVKAPANSRILIRFTNQDATPEEVESGELRFEKVIAGGAEGVVRIGPLKPGRYKFIGEFHKDSAQGVLVIE